MRNVAIYATTAKAISQDKLQTLVPDAKVEDTKKEAGFRVYWANVSVTINTMPSADIPRHLEGFCGYVGHLAGQTGQDVKQLLQRIRAVRLVHGVIIEPELDAEGKAERLIDGLLDHYKALLFTNDSVYDEQGQCLIGPPKGEPPGEQEEKWQPTAAQAARVERTKRLLDARKVPMLSMPLYIDDAEEVTLRASKEVERRVLVLWLLAMKGELVPHQEILSILKRFQVEEAISPKEQEFLHNPDPDPNDCARMVWRLEAIEALMWSLGYIPELGWPETFCNVPRLVKMLRPHETTPAFVGAARLRSKAEILDATDLTMKQHWAIREAWLEKKPIPGNFNWAKPSEMVPVTACAPSGIIEERHRAFNWLIRYGDADWDEVDTPT